MLENCDKIMHLRFNFDACPMHSPFGFVHLTHQNLSARALFCHNSLAKVNTQLLIYNCVFLSVVSKSTENLSFAQMSVTTFLHSHGDISFFLKKVLYHQHAMKLHIWYVNSDASTILFWDVNFAHWAPINCSKVNSFHDLISCLNIAVQNILTSHNWQKWKRVYMTWLCH